MMNDDELLALARMLRRGKGTFVLGFARCNSIPLRDALVARLKEALEPFGVNPIEVTLAAADVSALPERVAAAASDGQPLFVYSLDLAMPSADPEPALAQLNHRRARFGKIDSPIVLWMPEYALRLIAKRAPDFWSWNSGVYEFAPKEEIRAELYEREMGEPYQITTSLDRAEKEKRIHLLLGLLDDYEGDNPELARIRANVIYKIAQLQKSLGNYDEAARLYQRSLGTFMDLGDRRGVAMMQHGLADLYLRRGDYGRSQSLYHESLKTTLDLGDRHGVGVLQYGLANLYLLRGDYKQAEQLYRHSLQTALDLGDWREAAVTQRSLADLYRILGEYDQAEQLYQQSLKTALELGDRFGAAMAQNSLADLYRLRGNYDQAERLYQESLKVALDLGDRRSVAVAQHNLADFYRLRGDYEQAERLYQESLKGDLDLGDRDGVAVTQHGLAQVYMARGDYDQARQLYQQSLQTALDLDDRRGTAVTLHDLGVLENKCGNHVAALDLLTRSRELLAELGLDKDAARADETIASLKQALTRDK